MRAHAVRERANSRAPNVQLPPSELRAASEEYAHLTAMRTHLAAASAVAPHVVSLRSLESRWPGGADVAEAPRRPYGERFRRSYNSFEM